MADGAPRPGLASVALLVRDYDEAIAWFTQALRFTLLEDSRLSDTKRWVRVAPRCGEAGQGASGQDAAGSGATLLLARAATPEQQAMVGRQGAGRVWLFLHTADFAADHAHMAAHGVRFVESPRHEPYGTVVVFEDLYGNRWDLIGPRGGDTSI